MVSVVLFVIGLNTKIFGLRGCQFGKGAMWEKKGLPTMCLSVCSKEKKTNSKGGRHGRHVLYYSIL